LGELPLKGFYKGSQKTFRAFPLWEALKKGVIGAWERNFGTGLLEGALVKGAPTDFPSPVRPFRALRNFPF